MQDEQDANVDLAQLRSVTGGDLALEQEICRLFFDTAERCIFILEATFPHDEDRRWEDTLHEMKGAAINIGARGLVGLCHEAESIPPEEQSRRQRIVQSIQDEYGTVKRYVLAIGY